MINRLFGNYLVEKQILSQSQLDDLLPVQKELKAKVDTIAVINKVLTSAAAQELLGQIDENKEHFGEAAIEAGYLSDEKLDEILTYQSNSFMKFVQSLLDQGVFGLEQINSFLDGFQHLPAIANHFTEDTYETVDADALDNVGEFINCVNGLFATNLSYDDVTIDMNSPEYSVDGPFISNEKLYVIPIHANTCSFRAVLEVYE